MGAMTIVELIDVHGVVLNNLTTVIVMCSLVRKPVADKNHRMMMAGIIVVASNAGGAWSPIARVFCRSGCVYPARMVLQVRSCHYQPKISNSSIEPLRS
jgi:hypothetical protein